MIARWHAPPVFDVWASRRALVFIMMMMMAMVDTGGQQQQHFMREMNWLAFKVHWRSKNRRQVDRGNGQECVRTHSDLGIMCECLCVWMIISAHYV